MRQNIKKSYIRNLIKKVINESTGVKEGRMVDKFTPYTPEEREQNFIPFTNKDPRTLFQKNPSYEKALRDAEERRRQKQLQRNNELWC